MHRKYWLLLILLVGFVQLFAQIPTGTWRIHSQATNAKHIYQMGNSVFISYKSAVMEYDLTHNESSMFDITNGLSDIQISSMGKHDGSSTILVGYENGNLDIINKESTVINIPGIKLSSILGSKRINSIQSNGDYLYLATGFGVVKVDPRRKEISDTYYPSGGTEEIIEVTFTQDSIFALSKTRLYKSNISNPALADVGQWSVDSRMPILTDPDYSYGGVAAFFDKIYFSQIFAGYGKDSLFVAEYTGNSEVLDLGDFAEITSLQVVEDKLNLNCQGLVVVWNQDFTTNLFLQQYPNGDFIQANRVAFINHEVWIADSKKGALKRDFNGAFHEFKFSGPSDSRFYACSWDEGVLTVVPGTIFGNAESYFEPRVMFFEEENWTSIDRDLNSKWSAGQTWDVSSIARNPTNKDEYALGAYSRTPLSIVSKSNLSVVDTFSAFNSTLSRYVNGSTYLTSLKYDKNGNLWVLNGHDNNPLKLRNSDGEWHEFSLGAAGANRQSRKLFIDNFDNIWASFSGGGLVGYQPGDDVNSSSDDKRVVINTGQYTGELPSNNVTAIAMDFDDELWIGTDSGFGILYNSNAAFDGALGTYNVQRPKIQINDETDYILNNVAINDIEVDGGNRKWFATANSGMILLSDDGLSIIEHFTTENSPLVSNNILDLEIDHSTGEIYITTDLGLLSYRGDATYEDSDYSDVKVFPNPARPEFEGLITIQGIRYDSDIKITDISGNVVYRTTSNGGTATWNGKTLNGVKVASGVYLIWTASNVQKGRYVGKVVVIN